MKENRKKEKGKKDTRMNNTCMLSFSKLPKMYWKGTLKVKTYLQNRSPTSFKCNKITPCKIIIQYNRFSKLSYLFSNRFELFLV